LTQPYPGLVDCSRYKTKGSDIPCPRHLDPICGTDHNTYSNECMFCILKSQGKIRFQNDGKC
uniref:Kazal-like domain-containing protein n=2 Tax=Ursus TaxID=9639 RepID=A0A452TZ31_URSMA